MVLQYTIEYVGPGDNPKVNVLHAAGSASPGDLQVSWQSFLEVWAAWADNSYTATLGSEIRVLNTATGVLEDIINWDVPPEPVVGTVTTEPLPDATALLLRWSTGAVVSGRFLRGRSYIPGIATTYCVGGNPSAGLVTSMGGAAQQIADDLVGFQIWSRSHGTAANVTAGSCWTEFAQQRGRRG